MKRDHYATRIVALDDEPQRDRAQLALANAPLGIECVLREKVKPRKLDQNALMWVGPLADIAEQVWIDGRRCAAETWHEYFKRENMPEDDDPDLAELVTSPETYRKWDYDPFTGERVCIASTTRLTVKGMTIYLEKMFALGSQRGVRFGMKERRAA